MRRQNRIASLAAMAVLATGLVSVLPAISRFEAATADTATPGSAGMFVPASGRLLDTRNGTGGYATPMAANVVRTVPAAGLAGIPSSGVSAVASTLTAVGATTTGAVSVSPGDVASPTGTALVFNPGDSVSNADLVALHADGQLHVVANAAVTLIIDVQGYFTAGSAPAPGGFVPVDQARIVDTRSGVNVPQARVATGGSITVTAAGLANVPPGASAVYVNLAVLGQTSNGYLRAYAAGAAVPTTGALGFDDSTQTISVAVPLSADGRFTVLAGAGGPVDLLVDIQGYFSPAAPGGAFTPLAAHLLDTRAAPVQTLGGNAVLKLAVGGVAGIPSVADGLGAVALNLRTVQANPSSPANGFLRVWPSDGLEPATSSINYTSANTYRTDLAIVVPGADGIVQIRNGGPGPIDLVVDVEGWFAYSPGPKPNAADAAADQHGPELTQSEPTPETTGDPANNVFSGVFTNAAGQPAANLPVTISVPETAASDGTDSPRTVLDTVTTDAAGAWSYRPPATLPAAVQAVVDANQGVLNLDAEAMGTAPDGTILTGTADGTVGVATSSGSTDAAAAANEANQQQAAALHVAPASGSTTDGSAPALATVSAPSDSQAAQSDASTAQATGSDYQPSTWQADNAPTDPAYNPDLLNGVDYRAATVTPMNYGGYFCYVYDNTSKTSIAYTTVGEAHAYWDARASFTFSSSLSNSIKVEASTDGVHWSASGSVTLESQIGRATGFANQGPYFGRQFQVPIKYQWIRTTYKCLPDMGIGRSYYSVSYQIRPLGYSIPAGGYVSRYGNYVSDNDGYWRWLASNPAYRAVLPPNTYWAMTWGRSITYGVGVTVFGVGIASQTIYNSSHQQRIDAGHSRVATHDIWGARGSLNGNPGTFYSW